MENNENNTELRQAINDITLVGEVKEQKLNLNKNKEGNYINGSLVINTGDFSEIEIKVFVAEKNKKGKVKKSFETLQKLINEDYFTLASCKNDEDRENVAKVRIQGQKEFTPRFNEDIFKVKETEEVKTKVNIDLGFGNVTIDSSIKPEDYKATFDIEMFVTSVKEETKQDEPTGRAIVSGWTPIYGGKVIPMEVVVGIILNDDGEEFDFGEDILAQVEEGMTLNVWGDINYKSIITKTTKGGGLGRAKVEEHKEYINELVVVGADIQEDEDKEFDMELIKQAKIERDVAIEEEKNKEVDSKDKKGKGMGNKSGASASGTSGDKPKRERPKF